MDIQPGCTAFVTGGASGIGLGLARALAAAGVKLVLADVDEARVRETADGLTKAGATVLAIALDVRDEAAWTAAADQAWAWSGGGVRLLCNCAGVVFLGALAEQPVDLWRLTQDVNVSGPYLGIRTFLPRLLDCGEEARIVNVASMAGLWGENKLAAYTASKFAVVGLSEALQLELARTRVGVSVVVPGPTRTNLGRSTQWLGEHDGLLAPGSARPAAAPAPAPAAPGMDPDAVGRRIVEAVRADAFYVVTHPGWRPMLETRFNALRAAFGQAAEPGYLEFPELVAKLSGRLAVALASDGGGGRSAP